MAFRLSSPSHSFADQSHLHTTSPSSIIQIPSSFSPWRPKLFHTHLNLISLKKPTKPYAQNHQTARVPEIQNPPPNALKIQSFEDPDKKISPPSNNSIWVTQKPPISETQDPSKEVISGVFPCGFSRVALLGAASIGFMMLLAGIGEQRALAFGPEGPLMEDFWDNMRRYGLYALTVSTGAIYTIMEPILELLKNPISAILILVILAGSLFLMSQVLNAMFGITEFAYDYAY